MRIGGVNIEGPNEEILVLPRLGDDIIIRAIAVSDMSEFHALVPEPKPPGKLTKNGWEPTLNDETFKTKMIRYGEQRYAYMLILSLIPSEIEWETVDLNSPKTWTRWDEELRAAGLSTVEVDRISVCVMRANALDEKKLKEARDLFLLGMAEEQRKSCGLETEPGSTPSGEPASDSESDRQE
jgi:hypothetical protein